jgi:hypothetical protein
VGDVINEIHDFVFKILLWISFNIFISEIKFQPIIHMLMLSFFFFFNLCMKSASF